MSIHAEHPFERPPAERDQVRRLRGRLPAPVTLWTAQRAGERAGLTVSSMLVADGEPGQVLALLDPDSDLADLLADGGPLTVSLLTWRHRLLAEQFAGQAPAPGGPFVQAHWTDTAWGPVLADAAGWVGARLVESEPQPAGWSRLIAAVVEHVELTDEADPALMHRRGRYHQA